MKILTGNELTAYKRDNLQIDSNWEKRDFTQIVRKYLDGTTEKILAIGGLRGTGKTVGILQASEGLDVAYVLAQKGESETGSDYIDFLKNTPKKYIIIDEYSWIQERDELNRFLLTAVQNNKRIILTATESISLELLNYSSLNHRLQTIHTTMFTYDEYLRLNHKQHSKAACKNFLTEGGLFDNYILKNFDSTKEYIQEAIVENLANYLHDELDVETAKTLTYSVLYLAVCPSNLSKIPTLRENHVTLDNFLEDMGINVTIIPEEHEILRVADIFEQVGIIVRIPNFNENSNIREQFYITNPSLTCQLIKATYKIREVNTSILGHVFESVVAVQLATNKLKEHKIYFYNNSNETGNPNNKEVDLIITDGDHEYAYFFECKFSQHTNLDSDTSVISGYLEEHEFSDIEIEGRYVVYNGKSSIVKDYDVGTFIFTPLTSMLNNYFEFDSNVMDITNSETNKPKTNYLKEMTGILSLAANSPTDVTDDVDVDPTDVTDDVDVDPTDITDAVDVDPTDPGDDY